MEAASGGYHEVGKVLICKVRLAVPQGVGRGVGEAWAQWIWQSMQCTDSAPHFCATTYMYVHVIVGGRHPVCARAVV